MDRLDIDPRKGLIEIEVNDKGETITFDPADIELPFKFNDAYLEVEKVRKQWKAKEAVIKKKKPQQHGLVTTVDEEYRKLARTAYADMRNAMEKFLGAGAMQKIFGDRNYDEMYTDLFTALDPYLKKLGITIDDSVKRIKEKYSDKEEDVME